MVAFVAFRRCFRLSAVALFIAAITAIASPASARSHHGGARHAHPHHAVERHHHFTRHHRVRHLGRHLRRAASSFAAPQSTQSGSGFADSNAVASEPPSVGNGFGLSNIVATARSYIGGGNPTGRSSLWCARFMNMVLQRSGHSGTGSDMARSFASYGQRISGPQVGAIAVMSRGRRGGHVGVVSGIDGHGNPIVVSGNHGHRVAEAAYPRSRIYAYVMPAS
ncbi:TIGR02594 family protein [Rhodopseudomonas sp.]|uniref:TIGR02594 family protein n=1 Tax=Rhodopseudomonas sp. TaxID=1078 RepID=UPI0039C91AAF